MAHQNPHAIHKPDLPIIAPRPLKQSIGSPLAPRRALLPEAPMIDGTSEKDILSLPSPRISESFDDKPEIRELYMAAEEELKEIVEGFTHTFVHNLLRESRGHDTVGIRNLWECEEEDEHAMIVRDDVSIYSQNLSSFDYDDDSPVLEDLPHLGGSPSPQPERQSLSADLRNYYFLDDDFDEFVEEEWFEYQSSGEEIEPMESSFSADSRERITDTPPLRTTNPVSKNHHFGNTLVVVTSKNVIVPSEEEQRFNEWRQRRQARQRTLSEPPQKVAPFASSIECF